MDYTYSVSIIVWDSITQDKDNELVYVQKVSNAIEKIVANAIPVLVGAVLKTKRQKSKTDRQSNNNNNAVKKGKKMKNVPMRVHEDNALNWQNVDSIASFICQRGAMHKIFNEWRRPGSMHLPIQGLHFRHEALNDNTTAKRANLAYRDDVMPYNLNVFKPFIHGYETSAEFNTIFDKTARGCYCEMMFLFRIYNMVSLWAHPSYVTMHSLIYV